MHGSITITGADERTDVDRLARLDCEVAILYSASPEGRPRYPDHKWIFKSLSKFRENAIHVCGELARDQLLRGRIDHLACQAGRIQVNGAITVDYLERVCARFKDTPVITQHASYRNGQALLHGVRAENHQILVDASGGRGQLPAAWVRPNTTKLVGFAGGLGLDNLVDQLPLIIDAAGTNPWWIDMENKLRLNDWLCVPVVEEIVLKFHAATSFLDEERRNPSP